ncbi:hypothetical protein M2447_002789 [Ereboglobus sp. PH5-10]|uniref:hypothetical protein n=1 Tax=Ereboglobus sp. PH5-10 TaxID=2940629 RepID=UPI002404D1E4|nr:hypothetical protein [Ereboglobus sp. PH5-10]MDF9828661.1 hypothetical protein [Ereboglobus sp. PH5-10]
MNKVKKLLNGLFAVMLTCFCSLQASAAGELITADPATGDITVDAMSTAVKVVTVIAGIVLAAVVVWMIQPIIGWLKKLLFKS